MSPEKYKNKSSQENDDQGIKPIYTPASKLPTTKEGIRKPWNYFSPWQFWPSEPFQCGLCTRVHQRPAVRIFICNKHLSRNINNKDIIDSPWQHRECQAYQCPDSTSPHTFSPKGNWSKSLLSNHYSFSSSLCRSPPSDPSSQGGAGWACQLSSKGGERRPEHHVKLPLFFLLQAISQDNWTCFLSTWETKAL